MSKKILTYDDLYDFFVNQNKSCNFSSKESGYQISVQVPAQFEINKEQNDDTLLFCKVKIMHSGENRNHSSVTDDALVNAGKCLAYKPILANFCDVEDENGNTVKDFTSHDMEINDDGTTTYIEHQIGCFTADEAFTEVEEETGHNFLYGYCAIPKEYSDACDVITRKGGTKVSVELAINELQYNNSTKVLELTNIDIMGCTCLGTNPITGAEVQEGMKNARLDIADFSVEKNSVVNYAEKIDSMQEKLDLLLSRFDIDDSNKEGGNQSQMNKFEELMAKYNKTVEDIDFDYESMSDEELEAKFAELFGEVESDSTGDEEDVATEDSDNATEDSTDDEISEEESEETNEDEPSDVESIDDVEDNACGGGGSSSKKKKKNHSKEEIFNELFEISFNEIAYALNTLCSVYRTDDEWCYVTDVYDDYFVMQDWDNGKYYKQSYTNEEDNIALSGERIELFAMMLTESEKIEVENMRKNYASISEKLAKYEAEPEKIALLSSDDYKKISDTDDFKEFMKEESHFDMTVEEVKKHADDMLLAYAKSNTTTFAVKNTIGGKTFGVPTANKKKSRYGDLFKK